MITNVKITRTALGYEDHGIFTCFLALQGDNVYGTYGGYALDKYDGKQRVATAEGLQVIMEILKVFEVSSWEELTNMYARCEIRGQDIIRIGNLIKDKWFSFQEFFAKPEATVQEVKSEESEEKVDLEETKEKKSKTK